MNTSFSSQVNRQGSGLAYTRFLFKYLEGIRAEGFGGRALRKGKGF
ncbi:MAG: hypothetical protein O7B35_03710 [Deltaproteobacteria bacterium]|nr:hypothetical protein [Deltaproteobacteria bacterium]